MNRKKNFLAMNILCIFGGGFAFILTLFIDAIISAGFFFTYFGIWYFFIPKRLLGLVPLFDSVRKHRKNKSQKILFQDEADEKIKSITISLRLKLFLMKLVGVVIFVIGIYFLYIWFI
jgi:hypothetical protein